MIYLKQKNIAISSQEPEAKSAAQTLSFFEDPNWETVQTIVASPEGKFGVYFLASAQGPDDHKTINVSVVKPTKNPGDDLFSTQLAIMYGLNVPDSKLTLINRDEALAKLSPLETSSNQRTAAGSLKMR